jgi:hypothetical protein
LGRHLSGQGLCDVSPLFYRHLRPASLERRRPAQQLQSEVIADLGEEECYDGCESLGPCPGFVFKPPQSCRSRRSAPGPKPGRGKLVSSRPNSGRSGRPKLRRQERAAARCGFFRSSRGIPKNPQQRISARLAPVLEKPVRQCAVYRLEIVRQPLVAIGKQAEVCDRLSVQ